MMKQLLMKMDEVSRRDFAAQAAKAFLGVSVLHGLAGQLLAEEEKVEIPRRKKPAKSIIYLFMNGGMSHLDTLDPKPGTEVQGPLRAIPTVASGVTISESLPRLAKQMDKAALIRSLSTTQGAHERGAYFMRTSYTRQGNTQHPALGAWLLRLSDRSDSSLPGNVRIGGDSRHPGAGFMEAAFAPLPIGNPSAGLQNSRRNRTLSQAQFEEQLALSEQLDSEFRQRFNQKMVRSYNDGYADAIQLMTSKDLEAFNIKREAARTRQAYGNTPFGQGVLLARRLVENGVRFVEVTFGGWDTHQNNFPQMEGLADTLDQALATLLADLSDRGLLEETLVVVATEFGRTPIINQSAGRDHYPQAFSGLIAGGGIRGGQVYGSTDKTGSEVLDNVVEVPDFNATIAYGLGLPLRKPVSSPAGRPFKIADNGAPIKSLF